MVSSPINNNLWAYRVPEDNPDGIVLYGNPDKDEYNMPPGVWPLGHSIKTPTGAEIGVEKVVTGWAAVSIWYPNGLGNDYRIYFPQGQEIDNVIAYALDHDQNILYINLAGKTYLVNLNVANADGSREFVEW